MSRDNQRGDKVTRFEYWHPIWPLMTHIHTGAGGFFTKHWIAYLLLIPKIWTIKLFMNSGQIRHLNSKTADLDCWYYSRLYQKLKLLICDLIFTTFVKNPYCQVPELPEVWWPWMVLFWITAFHKLKNPDELGIGWRPDFTNEASDVVFYILSISPFNSR